MAEPVCQFAEGCHRVVACDPGCAVSAAALRDRIAEAALNVQLRLGPNALAMAQLGEPIRLSGGEADDLVGAVLAVLPEPATRADVLREAADAVAKMREATVTNVAVYPVYDGAQRLALSNAESLLRRLGGEPQPGNDEGGCPDPIECSHEAALGQAREEIRRLGLMVDEYGQGAGALTDKLKRVRDRHRETCPFARGETPTGALYCGQCEVLDAPATPVVTERPRCPHCQMPHDLTPGSGPVIARASIRASIRDRDAVVVSAAGAGQDETQEGDNPRTVCVCGHTRGEHLAVSGRLLCDTCDPNSTDNLVCRGFDAL